MKVFASIVMLCAAVAGYVVDDQTYRVVPTSYNNNHFTTELSRKLAAKNGDQSYVWSPLSLEMVLAAILTGASGETYDQLMENVFHLPNDQSHFTDYLQSLKKFVEAKITCGFEDELKLISMVVMDKPFPVQEQYKQELASLFHNMEFRQEDFSRDGDKVVDDINAKVADITYGQIQNVIEHGTLNGASPIVLVNAIYLYLSFKDIFSAISVKEMFYNVHGQPTGKLDFMGQNFESIPYYEDQNLQIIRLPFVDEAFNMYVALAKDWKTDLLAAVGRNITDYEFSNETVQVKLPKFKIEYSANDLAADLELLNVTNIFYKNKSKLDKMLVDPELNLFVSHVQQKATIVVKEESIEATAATSAFVNHSAGFANSPSKKQFIANHPFLFYVSAKHGDFTQNYETILFAGQYFGRN